jgi:uncharacterized protein YbaR (Trm112 family)
VRDDLLPVLACPVCAEPLARTAPGQAGCGNGHRYDEAKQGHLTLLPAKRRALTADTPAMVDARLRFLGRGHYAPVERALAAVVAASTSVPVPARTSPTRSTRPDQQTSTGWPGGSGSPWTCRPSPSAARLASTRTSVPSSGT